MQEALYRVQYKKDFAEMKKKYPMLSDDEIDEKIEEKCFEEDTTKKEDIESEATALLT